MATSFRESNRLEDIRLGSPPDKDNNDYNNDKSGDALPRHFRLVVGVRDGIHAAEAPLLVTILTPEGLKEMSG